MAVDSTTYAYLQALGIGVVVSLILFLVFCILRPKVPDVFYHRRLLNTWKEYDDFNGTRVGLTEPPLQDSFFGWLTPVISTTEEEIVRKIGLDAAMFLRYLKTSLFMLSILGLFSVVILMPVYGTGDNKNLPSDNEQFVEGLRVISLANVPDRDGRLWATVIAEFVVTAVVLFFMFRDYREYARLRREYRISENPVNYALAVLDIPPECRTEAAIRDRFELVVPGQIAEVILVKQCGKAFKLEKNLNKAVANREKAEYIKAVKGETPQTRPGCCGCLMCHKPKVDALEHWQSEQDRLSKELLEEGSLARQTPGAIIVLSNKRAAALLAQANVATRASQWNIDRAAEPEAIHWPAFGVPGYQAEVRSLAVLIFMIVFTLFWTIPAFAIASLASLEDLSKISAFSWLDSLTDLSPAVVSLIEGVLPVVVLAVIISLIPVVFRLVVGQERLVSKAIIERKTRDYFYMFTVYGSFFVIVLGSTVLRDLDGIIDDPTSIVDALATGVPGQGVFFATFIVLKTFIPLPLALSGIVRCIMRWIFLKLAKTERAKRGARSKGSLFPYFRHFGSAMLIMFLALTYSAMSPIVPISGLVYFCFANLTYRYQILYSSHTPWDGGGELYPGAFWGTIVGLIIQQLVVIGVLGLKKGIAEAIVTAIPFVLTILLPIGFTRRYSRIAKDGSLYDMFEDSSKLDEIPAQYNGVYENPAGKVIDFVNLNGIEEIKDVYSDVGYDLSDNNDGLHSEHPDEDVGYVPDRAANREDV